MIFFYSLSITQQQIQDMDQIIRNKQELMTENKLNVVSNPWAIPSRQDKATSLINSMIRTNGRTYLWNQWKNIEQGAQLLQTVNCLQQIATAYAIIPYYNTTSKDDYPNIHYKNITTLNIITSALDYIFTTYYKADLVTVLPPLSGTGVQGWWDWQIGITEALNNIIILIFDGITQNQISQFAASSRRFLPNSTMFGYLAGTNASPNPSTGGNLVDTSRICFLRGLITKNITEADLAFHGLDHIMDFVTTSDGFYKDYSFIQHETTVASASYGLVVFSGLTDIIVILNGSAMYHYSKTSISNIFDFILNAEMPLLYSGQMMNMVNGRGVSRKEQEYRNGAEFIRLLTVLSECAPSSQIQLQMHKLIKHHVNKAKPFADFTSQPQFAHDTILRILKNTSIPDFQPEFLHKRFSSMARVVHRRENFAFALSMHSYKVGDYESFSIENLHGWYGGDGAEYMYSNYQKQYVDYFPSVNPYLLQGTTELTSHRNDGDVDGVRNYQMSNATFVGGTDLNGIGVVGMEFYNYNYKLGGFRSWFMFDQSVMIIANYNSTETYRSTVLNRILGSLDQKVFVDSKVIPNDLKSYTCNKIFVEGTGVNDSIGIIFLKPTQIFMKKELRTGDWSQIGTDSGAVQRNYVTGYVEKTNAFLELQYVILFGCNQTEFDLKQNDYQVSQNSSVHIVKHTENNVTYEAANIFNLTAGQSVSLNNFKINSNASVLIKTADKVQISISDPTQKQNTLNFTYYDQEQIVNVKGAAGASSVFEYLLNNKQNKCGTGCAIGIGIGVSIVILLMVIFGIIFHKAKITSKQKLAKKPKQVKKPQHMHKTGSDPIF
ncbi:polysaccharide_lyase 8 family protein [Hexamita inflata]|uniref:Polysaccharide lyase 8 family protein n=1 Tax=Hexamita inflata TaxID=28002 RepID=A0AA86R5M9_9EUKA|nr:polysaccharide lyase 8 family protein [Hexamita inflata]